MRKLFTFLCAALMSVGMYAATTEPQPAEVTVVFAANSKTVERTVTLPHEFLCSYYNANGELDAIIQELYGISDGRCCDYIYPVASGNEAVLAGSYGSDNYITISAAFEGTATVSGRYWNWDAYDGDGDWMDYSLTISIKGDEPEPTTYTLQLVADPEKGSVAVTNLLGSDIIDNGNGNYTVPENAEVTILATPLEGYEFSGWKVGNIDEMVGCYYCGVALNTLDNPLTITMTEDKAYLAEFEAATGVENVQGDKVQSTKFFRDGQLLIKKNGKIYNALGAEVK